MSTPITGSSTTLKKTTNIPQDGVEDVNQASVLPAFQDLLNNTYYLSRTQVYTRPQVSIQCLNGTNIIIQPFKGIFVSTTSPTENWVEYSKTTTTSLSGTNVEGGGGYVANTVYYIYLIAAGVSPSFILSTDAPDASLTFRVTAGTEQINHRYMGSCTTYDNGGTPTVVPYKQTNLTYTLSGKFGATNYSGAPMASGATFNDVTFTTLPATAKIVDTVFYLLNDIATDGQLFYTAKGSETLLTASDFDVVSNTGASRRVYIKSMGTGTSNACAAKLSPADANRNVTIYWIGYKE
mgnify:CR=1 FL=1